MPAAGATAALWLLARLRGAAAFELPASGALPNPPPGTQVNFAASVGSVALDGSGTVAAVGAAGNAATVLGVATVYAQAAGGGGGGGA